MYTRIAIAALAIIGSISCGIAEGPREKLRHSAFLFNEGLRWNRYNEVLPRVDPAAQEHFSQMHEGWGENLRVESADIVQSVYDSKTKKADISVKFTWYRLTEMEVCTTVTVQHWEYTDAGWIMMAEEYKSGTPF